MFALAHVIEYAEGPELDDVTGHMSIFLYGTLYRIITYIMLILSKNKNLHPNYKRYHLLGTKVLL